MLGSVRISKPAKTAMQSGRANTTRWLLEYAPADAQEADPLMGWAGSRDTNRQLKLYARLATAMREEIAHLVQPAR